MMNLKPVAAEDYEALRARATLHLRAGNPNPADAPRALQALFELAGSPATAAKALALLHELQIHQVEIELQDEDLRRTRTELETALARHLQLYDAAPAAYLTIDADTTLREANLTAERIFRHPRSLLLGRTLQSFLTPRTRTVLAAMLAQLDQDTAATQGELLLSSGVGAPRALHATASPDPGGPGFLVVLVEETLVR